MTGGVSLSEFQDCDKADAEMPEYDARRKKSRGYNDFGPGDPAGDQQYQQEGSQYENQQQ